MGKKKRGYFWKVAPVGVMVAVLSLGLMVIADPGVLDLPIRHRIKSLDEDDCKEIIEGCENLYLIHIDSLDDSVTRISEDIPKPAKRVGYKRALIKRDGVYFRAGAGAFSQVGSIMIICWIDPDTRKAVDLALDDGRHFHPATGQFGDSHFESEVGYR